MRYSSRDWSELLWHNQDALSESVEVVLVPEVPRQWIRAGTGMSFVGAERRRYLCHFFPRINIQYYDM